MAKQKQIAIANEAEFRGMWTFGVARNHLVRYFGCSRTTIVNTAKRLKLNKREVSAYTAKTIEDYRAEQLRLHMAASAAETRRAMAEMEMVDHPAYRPAYRKAAA